MPSNITAADLIALAPWRAVGMHVQRSTAAHCFSILSLFAAADHDMRALPIVITWQARYGTSVDKRLHLLKASAADHMDS
jgi:hypothetical protein